jgi:hypothetical protein
VVLIRLVFQHFEIFDFVFYVRSPRRIQDGVRMRLIYLRNFFCICVGNVGLSGDMEVRIVVLEADHGVMEAQPGDSEAQPRAMKANYRAFYSACAGALKASPDSEASKAPLLA